MRSALLTHAARRVALAAAAASLALAGLALPAQAVQTVYLDFTSDAGDGTGGSANGTADWVDNLDAVTGAAGVAPLTAGERAGIESGIRSQLETMYAAYEVTFSTAPPEGWHERIDFGAFSSVGGNLGLAPLDFMNLDGSDGSAESAAKVYTNNFAFVIESADPRPTILTELTTAFAGTGGHELAHSFGPQHHHAYGDPGITPANYGNTGGVQNTHVLATASTGLGETGRETLRAFSQWEHLTLEAAGGADPSLHGTSGTALAATVLPEIDAFSTPDVGGIPAAATALPLTFLPISGLHAANAVSRLSNDGDVDVFKFDVTAPGRILADVWAENRYSDSFDALLRLLAPDGTTVLAAIDNTTYTGNAFNDGTLRSFDPSLLNVALPLAGTYYLEVSSLNNFGGGAGGSYNLIFGVVPEPPSIAVLVAAGITAFVRRRRLRAIPAAHARAAT